ncbi:DUF3108 domain-containing protein [Pararobbsia silviterrae]|uniref:DUF3108 domain-containing protein n=2 Tax=Pararobbsia silviterrae TaxID=1792498 RepID=A0A494Y9M6_9BURK|nr:DUF3108 domain-containing protein [Pararobbsia silviterrae]
MPAHASATPEPSPPRSARHAASASERGTRESAPIARAKPPAHTTPPPSDTEAQTAPPAPPTRASDAAATTPPNIDTADAADRSTTDGSSAAPAATTPQPTADASSPASATASLGASAASDAGAGPGVAAHAANAHDGEKFSLPPSSELRYDSFYNGVQNPSGTIHWTTDGTTYQMIVSIPLPFVGTYSYISEGRIDAFGLSPLRYTEQHGRRGTDVTTFDRDENDGKPHASFTRAASSVDLPPGAQDRFSMFMQLSSLVRGNPTRYTPGVTRQFFVLDNDSGETWPIETVGDEVVRTSQGFVPARHFTRLPRREGDRRKIDVWLAQSLGWLPIRFVQTEPDGTQIELRFAGSIAHDDAAPTRDGNMGDASRDDTHGTSAPSPSSHDNATPEPAHR